METKSKTTEKEFHAVDFMRQVRRELTQQFLQEKIAFLLPASLTG